MCMFDIYVIFSLFYKSKKRYFIYKGTIVPILNVIEKSRKWSYKTSSDISSKKKRVIVSYFAS